MTEKTKAKLREKFSILEGSDSYNDYDEDFVVSEFDTMQELFNFIDEHFVEKEVECKCLKVGVSTDTSMCKKHGVDILGDIGVVKREKTYTKEQVLELIGEDEECVDRCPIDVCECGNFYRNQVRQEIRSQLK